MIKQQLSQKQQQKLSPLQIQQIKMLELTTLELEDRIAQELEENPALEELDEFQKDSENDDMPDEFQSDDYDSGDNLTSEELTLGDYLTEDDVPDYKFQQSNYSSETKKEEIPYSESESFQEYLFDQLRLRSLSDDKYRIAEYLVGNIDEDGYLRRDLDAISDDLAFQYGVEVPIPEIKSVLSVVQELDPPGVAAANLQECLLLQLERKNETPYRKLAIITLKDYFEEFSKKHFDKIVRVLNITEDDLKEIIKEVTLLNPRPGSAWESNIETKMAQVTPDFLVEAINGELYFSMTQQNIPELRVSQEYVHMFDDYAKNKKNQSPEKKDALLFVKQKLDSAKWFIDAVRQRQNTLKDTMMAIINIQRDFFLSGEDSDLKPMILKDVAEMSGYDISTISRVSNSKYVQTNYGTYPLKYFFSEALYNDIGEEVSTREVKAILKACIEKENKSKPLTDDALVKELKNKGYEVARRTIAKYREQLGIPVARLRKEI